MQYIQSFILTLLDIVAVMFFWDSLVKERRNIIKYIIIVIATSILVVLSNLTNFATDYIIKCIVPIILMIILFHKKIDEVLIEYGIVTVLVIVVEMLVMLIAKVLKINAELFQTRVFINLMFLIISIGINIFVPIGKSYNRYKEYIRKAYIFFINIAFYLLVTKFIWESNRKLFWDNIMYLAVITAIFVTFNIIVLINNVKYQEQKKIIENYNRYNPIMTNLMEDIKRRQHDFKNHLNTIYGMAQVTEEKNLKDALKDYIKSLDNSIQDNDSLIQIENETIAAIIYSKICEAKNKKIKFLYRIENNIDLKLKQYELSEILNNLLDNAFEAVNKNKLNDNKIFLNLYREGEKGVIELKNTTQDENILFSNKLFKRGFSTKVENGHGYGLYNIKKIVESYNGKIQLSLEENLIVFKIYI